MGLSPELFSFQLALSQQTSGRGNTDPCTGVPGEEGGSSHRVPEIQESEGGGGLGTQ